MAGEGFKDYPPEVDARAAIINDPEEQAKLANRACLPPEFLETEPDPWKLTATDYISVSRRDPVLADGWLGIRISPDGECTAFRGDSQHFCYGLRRGKEQREGGWIGQLPLFATLQVAEPRIRHGRPIEQVLNFEQNLDLKTASIETKRRVENVAGCIDVKHRVYLPRQHRGVVVIEMELTRVAGKIWEVEELFSTEGVEEISDLATKEVAGALELTAAVSGRHLAIHSRILSDANLELAVEATLDGVKRSAMITLAEHEPVRIWKVVACAGDEYDADPLAAARERVTAVVEDLPGTWDAHCAAWDELWSTGIRTPQNPAIQTLINASQFQLLSATRPDIPAGIPPCGLAADNWKGSVFWDMDSWMQPPIDFLHPQLSRGLCQNRIISLPHAQQRAAERGYEGADYPWMCTDAGLPVQSGEVGELQRHVTGGVARSLWQHYVVTGDLDWLRDEAWPVFRETSTFWLSRATDFSSELGSGKTIAGVRQADEYAPVGQCHALTNATAAWSLRQSTIVAGLIGADAPAAWNELADQLVIPRDPDTGRILQWDGWHDQRVIKQADTTLLIHPWNLVSEKDEMRDLLDYYGAHYDPYLIMMAKAIDAIVACRVQDVDQAWDIFGSLLQWYRQPFLLTSESSWNECVSFLTGQGGFLQVLLHGFAGLTLDGDQVRFQPCLPPQIPELVLEGLSIHGKRHRVTVTADGVSMTELA